MNKEIPRLSEAFKNELVKTVENRKKCPWKKFIDVLRSAPCIEFFENDEMNEVYSISISNISETTNEIIFSMGFQEEGQSYHFSWGGENLIYRKDLDAVENVELEERYGDGDVKIEVLLKNVFQEVKIFTRGQYTKSAF